MIPGPDVTHDTKDSLNRSAHASLSDAKTIIQRVGPDTAIFKDTISSGKAVALFVLGALSSGVEW